MKVFFCVVCITLLVACDRPAAKHDSAAASAPASSATRPGPLTAADFAIGGIGDTVDSQSVRRVLGPPDSVTKEDHPFDRGAQFTEWYYPGMIVSLSPYGGAVHGITISSERFPTGRGLRVGDPVTQTRLLYGMPADTTGNEWEYSDPDSATNNLHVVRVSFAARRVTRIFVGWLVD